METPPSNIEYTSFQYTFQDLRLLLGEYSLISKHPKFTLGPSIETWSNFERSSDFVASVSLSKRFFELGCNKNMESKYLELTTLDSESQNLTELSNFSFWNIFFILSHKRLQRKRMPLSETKVH